MEEVIKCQHGLPIDDVKKNVGSEYCFYCIIAEAERDSRELEEEFRI